MPDWPAAHRPNMLLLLTVSQGRGRSRCSSCRSRRRQHSGSSMICTKPSAGRSMSRRAAAELAADVVKLIRTLTTVAHVAGFDETTLRAELAREKKYVLGAFNHSLNQQTRSSALGLPGPVRGNFS